MYLSLIKESRLNSLSGKYKPIIKTYTDTINMINSISIKNIYRLFARNQFINNKKKSILLT